MVDTVVSTTIHLVFAAIWAGTVVFVALVILPLVRDGGFTTTSPLQTVSSKVRTISRVSSLVLLLTGGHLAGRGYTTNTLVSTTNGQLVLVMVGLWVALIALVEIGSSRFEAGLETKKLREPAQDALRYFRLAAVVAVALLVVSGLLSADVVAWI